MAFTYAPNSTLSAALNESDNKFDVASTTNVSVGDLLVFRNEIMHVREIPVSGTVVVRRGYEGTRALTHKSGDTFFIGTAEEFGALREHTLGLFGEGVVVPNIAIPGSRARDVNGNEYVLVDMTASVKPGATVLISKDGLYTASILTSTGIGPVGLTIDNGTSNQWIWVQIYGYNGHAKLVGGSSLVTSTGHFAGATSVSTPSVGLLGRTSSEDTSETYYGILGMFPTSAASTASTSATSETGYYCSVWLQYPYLQPRLQFVTS